MRNIVKDSSRFFSGPQNLLLVNYDIVIFIKIHCDKLVPNLEKDTKMSEEQKQFITETCKNSNSLIKSNYLRQMESDKEFEETLYKKETQLFDHKFGIQFITYFFGFFNFYKVDTRDPTKQKLMNDRDKNSPDQAITNINLVYQNFYHLLNQLRIQMITPIKDHYSYVLNTLETCLEVTE